MTAPAISQETILHVVETWLAAATADEALAFWTGRYGLTLADGTAVAWSVEPGVLYVNETPLYSAVWRSL